MEDAFQKVIDRITKNKGINVLLRRTNPQEAFDKCITLVPEIMEEWDLETTLRFMRYLQQVYYVNFNICVFLIIQRDKLFCGIDGNMSECEHDVIAEYCENRDKGRKPEQSNYPPIRLLEVLRYYGTCAGL